MPAVPFIPLAISAGTSIYKGIKEANAAKDAAKIQAQSADRAMGAQSQAMQPFLNLGGGSANTLAGMMQPGYGGPGGSLLDVWNQPFQRPTADTMNMDPGYQFRMGEGAKAIERGAASRGNLLTGGTAKALTRYGQDFASNEYDKIYNRALGEYGLARDVFETGQANRYGRLFNLANLGQGAASSYANSMGNLMTGQGDVQAAGRVGSANAWSNMAGDLGNIGMDFFTQRYGMPQQPGATMPNVPTTTLADWNRRGGFVGTAR